MHQLLMRSNLLISLLLPCCIFATNDPTPTPTALITDNNTQENATWTIQGDWFTLAASSFFVDPYRGNFLYTRLRNSAAEILWEIDGPGLYDISFAVPKTEAGLPEVIFNVMHSGAVEYANVSLFEVSAGFHPLATPFVQSGNTLAISFRYGSQSKFFIADAYQLQPLNFQPLVVITSNTTENTVLTRTSPPALVTFNFSEPVLGLNASAISVAGGQACCVEQISSSLFTALISPNYHSSANIVVSLSTNSTFDTSPESVRLGNKAEVGNFSIAVDTINPSVYIDTEYNGVITRSTGPVLVSFVFSKYITVFSSSNVIVSGGSINSFVDPSVGSNSSYVRVLITANDQSTQNLTVSLLAGVTVDKYGNPNNASEVLSFVVDTVSPVATLTSSLVNGTTLIVAQRSVIVNVTFNENLIFSESKLLVTGANKTFLGQFGMVYSFQLTAPAESTESVTASIPKGTIVDLNDNPTIADARLVFPVDTQPPVITMSSNLTQGSYINVANSWVILTVNFSQPVVNFRQGFEVNATGINIADIVQVEALKKFRLVLASPMGVVSTANISISVVDSAANPTTAQFIALVDTSAPTVSITTTLKQPKVLASTGTFQATLAFSEPTYQSISDANLNFTGGEITKFLQQNSTHYVIDLRATSSFEGTLTLGVRAGVTYDVAGNTNLASELISLLVDTLPPSVSVTPQTNLTQVNANTPAFDVVVVFSEPVFTFNVSTATIALAQANITLLNTTSYLITLTPSQNAIGTLLFQIIAAVVFDVNGNPNIASSTTVSIPLDTTIPTATITTALSPVTELNNTHTIILAFSETVENVDPADFAVVVSDDGTLPTLSIGLLTASRFELIVTFAANRETNATITFPANCCQKGCQNLCPRDTFGNMVVGGSVSLIVDTKPPLATVSPQSTVCNANNIVNLVTRTTMLRVNFGENVTAGDQRLVFSPSSLLLNSSLVASTAKSYDVNATFQSGVSGPTTVSVAIPANVGYDGVGNGNALTSNAFSLIVDTKAPTGAFSTSYVTSKRITKFTGAITFTVTFDEAVTGFTLSDISVTGATTQNLRATTTALYTFVAVARDNSTVPMSFAISSNSVQDLRCNGNPSFTPSFQILVDTTTTGLEAVINLFGLTSLDNEESFIKAIANSVSGVRSSEIIILSAVTEVVTENTTLIAKVVVDKQAVGDTFVAVRFSVTLLANSQFTKQDVANSLWDGVNNGDILSYLQTEGIAATNLVLASVQDENGAVYTLETKGSSGNTDVYVVGGVVAGALVIACIVTYFMFRRMISRAINKLKSTNEPETAAQKPETDADHLARNISKLTAQYGTAPNIVFPVNPGDGGVDEFVELTPRTGTPVRMLHGGQNRDRAPSQASSAPPFEWNMRPAGNSFVQNDYGGASPVPGDGSYMMHPGYGVMDPHTGMLVPIQEHHAAMFHPMAQGGMGYHSPMGEPELNVMFGMQDPNMQDLNMQDPNMQDLNMQDLNMQDQAHDMAIQSDENVSTTLAQLEANVSDLLREQDNPDELDLDSVLKLLEDDVDEISKLVTISDNPDMLRDAITNVLSREGNKNVAVEARTPRASRSFAAIVETGRASLGKSLTPRASKAESDHHVSVDNNNLFPQSSPTPMTQLPSFPRITDGGLELQNADSDSYRTAPKEDTTTTPVPRAKFGSVVHTGDSSSDDGEQAHVQERDNTVSYDDIVASTNDDGNNPTTD